MPPPLDHPCLHLQVSPNPYFVVKLAPHEPVPQVVLESLVRVSNKFMSLTRTPEEISVVGEWDEDLPEQFKSAEWKCIKMAGPMEFSLTGVIVAFATPLKAAGVSVFVMSTWNTDYVLVPREKIETAVEILKADGWRFVVGA